MIEFEGRQIPGELSEIVDPSHTALLVWDMAASAKKHIFSKLGDPFDRA